MKTLTTQDLVNFRLEDFSEESRRVSIASSRIKSVTAAVTFMLNASNNLDLPPVNFLEEASRVFAVPSEQLKWYFV